MLIIWGPILMGAPKFDDTGHFWQLGSIASLATETTGGEILVAFWPKHGLRSDLRVPNLKIFSWESMPPDPPSLFTLKRTQWPYQSKIAGSGPESCIPVNIVPHIRYSLMNNVPPPPGNTDPHSYQWMLYPICINIH